MQARLFLCPNSCEMRYLPDGTQTLWLWRCKGMKIDVEQLCVQFGDTKILKGVDLNVGDREFVGVIGPNGSGKSTLLKCIYRVLEPNAGLIELDGKKLKDYAVKESAKKVAVVAQHNYYNFEFSVQEVVMMGRAPHKRTLERDNAEDYRLVHEALKKVNMEDFENRSFSTLSGGEQQRIILARALTQQTPCLILDEPTNHLDIKYQLQLMDIVKSLDLTVISAIHDLNIAAMYCDRLFVMKDGHIVGFGTPEEMLTQERIKEIYEVDAEVRKDSQGHLHILYFPAHWAGASV